MSLFVSKICLFDFYLIFINQKKFQYFYLYKYFSIFTALLVNINEIIRVQIACFYRSISGIYICLRQRSCASIDPGHLEVRDKWDIDACEGDCPVFVISVGDIKLILKRYCKERKL